MFCQFLFRWIYYYHSDKSTGKESGKTHLSALLQFPKMFSYISFYWRVKARKASKSRHLSFKIVHLFFVIQKIKCVKCVTTFHESQQNKHMVLKPRCLCCKNIFDLIRFNFFSQSNWFVMNSSKKGRESITIKKSILNFNNILNHAQYFDLGGKIFWIYL